MYDYYNRYKINKKTLWSEFLISSKSSQRIIDLITEVHEDIYLTSIIFTHPEDFSSIFSILVKYGKSTSKYILSKGEIYE